MNRLASPAQLRASYFRWALFLVPLIVLLGIGSGLVGGSTAESPWFMALKKPATFPPPIAFPVVWTVLYVMMGLALALVCAAWGARWRGAAILAFVIQLAVNLAWTPTFFGAHEIGLALYVILALDVLVIVTVWLLWKVRRAAAVLMLPYLAWILFATVLNWQFLQLNQALDGAEVSSAVQRIEI
ncbi:MAG: tryptophan-rich sensory protein [Altererythrobacter sp.]|nr:tryptophan-rich sensory protein [Altererythrobacter sp.]OJU59506.1 MAG: tryptophan-rich sensory protein [Altererythrobacter sp. 66-12]